MYAILKLEISVLINFKETSPCSFRNCVWVQLQTAKQSSGCTSGYYNLKYLTVDVIIALVWLMPALLYLVYIFIATLNSCSCFIPGN